MESEYMSFSTEVKNELCSVSMSRACCTRAEAYGALLHASVFSHKEIRLSAENAVVVRRLQALLQRAFFVDSDSFSFLSAAQALLLSSSAACTASSCAFPW